MLTVKYIKIFKIYIKIIDFSQSLSIYPLIRADRYGESNKAASSKDPFFYRK